MKLQFPWARRAHSHSDPTLFRYGICSGCGHLIFQGHVRNKYTRVIDRVRGLEFKETYGEKCAPNYDLKEIGLDGEVKYYEKGQRVKSLPEKA